METQGPTDLEYLVSLGYPYNKAQKALGATYGDKDAALLILRRGNSNPTPDESDTIWREETTGDWVAGLSGNLPKSAEARALWKSPLYASVSGTARDWSGGLQFMITVVQKDSRSKSQCAKTYIDFCELRAALPFGMCRGFKSWFPIPSLFSGGLNTREKIEERRRGLDDWLRELTMSFEAMKNKVVLDRLYKFLEVVPIQTEQTSAITRTDRSSPTNVPFSIWNLPPQISQPVSPPPSTLSSDIAQPLTVENFSHLLPFKIKVPRELTGSNFVTDKQLEKDYSRDRIIVQGRRLEGHTTAMANLVTACVEVIESLMNSKGKCCERISELEEIVRSALRLFCRTESAFVSYEALRRILGLGNVRSENDSVAVALKQSATEEDRDYLLVPEATLADAISIHFRIIENEEKTPMKIAMPRIPTQASPKQQPDVETTPIPYAERCSQTDRLESVINGGAPAPVNIKDTSEDSTAPGAENDGIVTFDVKQNGQRSSSAESGDVISTPETESPPPSPPSEMEDEACPQTPSLAGAQAGESPPDTESAPINSPTIVPQFSSSMSRAAAEFIACPSAAPTFVTVEPWCVCIEAKADSVYRVSSADSLRAVLQVRAAYRKTLFVMIGQSQNSRLNTAAESVVAPHEEPVAVEIRAADEIDISNTGNEGLSTNPWASPAPRSALLLFAEQNKPVYAPVQVFEKEGSAFVSFERETKTTTRDWK